MNSFDFAKTVYAAMEEIGGDPLANPKRLIAAIRDMGGDCREEIRYLNTAGDKVFFRIFDEACGHPDVETLAAAANKGAHYLQTNYKTAEDWAGHIARSFAFATGVFNSSASWKDAEGTYLVFERLCTIRNPGEVRRAEVRRVDRVHGVRPGPKERSGERVRSYYGETPADPGPKPAAWGKPAGSGKPRLETVLITILVVLLSITMVEILGIVIKMIAPTSAVAEFINNIQGVFVSIIGG